LYRNLAYAPIVVIFIVHCSIYIAPLELSKRPLHFQLTKFQLFSKTTPLYCLLDHPTSIFKTSLLSEHKRPLPVSLQIKEENFEKIYSKCSLVLICT